jgi:hypothetical protein
VRPFRSLLPSFFLVLALPLYALAAPPMGTYIAPDSFPAGTWAELLNGSQEGKAGNVISAQSPGYFLFEKIEFDHCGRQIHPGMDLEV